MKYPTTYQDLTVTEFLYLINWDGLDYTELISLWTGEAYDLCLNHIDRVKPNTFDFLNMNVVDFLNKLERPNKLVIDGKSVKIPEDLMIESFGKKLIVSNMLQRVNQAEEPTTEILNNLSYIVAVYLCDRFYGKFESSSIPELVGFIDKLKIVDVYPIALFFFRKLNDLTYINLSGTLSPQFTTQEEEINAEAIWTEPELTG